AAGAELSGEQLADLAVRADDGDRAAAGILVDLESLCLALDLSDDLLAHRSTVPRQQDHRYSTKTYAKIGPLPWQVENPCPAQLLAGAHGAARNFAHRVDEWGRTDSDLPETVRPRC